MNHSFSSIATFRASTLKRIIVMTLFLWHWSAPGTYGLRSSNMLRLKYLSDTLK